MDLREIRESGLLESYVLGELSQADFLVVENAVKEHPELSKDLFEIEEALNVYAQMHAISPPPGLKSKIMTETGAGNVATKAPKSQKEGGSFWPWVSTILAALIFAAIIWGNHLKTELESLQEEFLVLKDSCDAQTQEQDVVMRQYQEMVSAESTVAELQATEKYPGTSIYLYSNAETSSNYLQLRNLPPITAQQSYQLWSLKGNQAPIPLDVFDSQNQIVKVAFEAGTNTYAITIEKKGGSQTPDLDNLIGTIPVT